MNITHGWLYFHAANKTAGKLILYCVFSPPYWRIAIIKIPRNQFSCDISECLVTMRIGINYILITHYKPPSSPSIADPLRLDLELTGYCVLR
jgi:hypothetical protein